MFSLYDKVPGYLVGKSQLAATAVFTVLFSLVCLLLCIPFLRNIWFNLAQGPSFLYTFCFFALSFMFEFVSKSLLSRFGHTKEMAYFQLALWEVAEVIIVSLLYCFFTIQAIQAGFLDQEAVNINRIFFGAMLFTIIGIGVPFVVAAQYFALQDKDNTIRLMNYGNVVSDTELPAIAEKRITLFDNSGVLKLSISPDNLFFIESDDNYVQVWYMDGNGQMKQYMLRCRLKTIENSFADSDLVRCHRKYVININKIKILTSEREGYFADLDIDSVDPIPVSKTYESQVLARFNSR